MGLTLQEKEEVKRKVGQGYQSPPVAGAAAPAVQRHEAVRSPAPADELIIEVTGNDSTSSITMRPAEISRLRGRFGKGPGFEKWVAGRIRDGLISFGGG